MKRKKRERLEKAGWKVGSAERFLGLSAEEARFIELKLALSEAVRRQRSSAGLSQEERAKRLGSSQSRVSKMEKADPTVSVDLLVRTMLAAGATRRDIAAAIASNARRRDS
ncbi:MAG: helix-turn-helix domain-containing protein [Vicinamibacteria bacterium]